MPLDSDVPSNELLARATAAASREDWAAAVSYYMQAAKLGLAPEEHAAATPWLEHFAETQEATLGGVHADPRVTTAEQDPESFGYRLASHLVTVAMLGAVATDLAQRYESGVGAVKSSARAAFWRSKAEGWHDRSQATANQNQRCVAFACDVPADKRALLLLDGLIQVNEFCGRHLDAITHNLDLRKLSIRNFPRIAQWRCAERCFEVGKRYLLGDGVDQDGEEAIRWLAEGAKLGSVDSHIFLFLAFSDGIAGIPVNEHRAIKESWSAFRLSLRPPRNWRQIWLLGGGYLRYRVGTWLVSLSRT